MVDGMLKRATQVWTKSLVMVGAVMSALVWAPANPRGPCQNAYLVLKIYRVVRQHYIGSWSIGVEDTAWLNRTHWR